MRTVYAVKWTGSGSVGKNLVFTSKERAERIVEINNNLRSTKWRKWLTGHHWFVSEMTLVEGEEKI